MARPPSRYSRRYGTSHSECLRRFDGVHWLICRRDIERDLLPMARHYGMAIIPWSALGSGKLKNAEAVSEIYHWQTFTRRNAKRE